MLRFNGTNAACWTAAAVTMGTGFSLAARIRANSMGASNQGSILAQTMPSMDRWAWAFDGEPGGLRIEFSAKWLSPDAWVSWSMDQALATGREYSIGVTYQPANSATPPKMYVRGTVAAITQSAASSSASFGPDNQVVYMGNWSDMTRGWDGELGELAIWPSVILSDAEMAAVFRRGPLARPNGLYAYWPLDDGTTCRDYSGNGRHASQQNCVQVPGMSQPPARLAGARAR